MQENIRQNLYTLIEEPFEHGHRIYIGSFVHIRPDVHLGDDVEIRDYCFIAPGVTIGSNTRIYQYCNIGAGTSIGDNCFIGLGTVTLNDKEIEYPVKGSWEPTPPVIGNNVRIGARAIILPGVWLADFCRIGAGAVVTKDTEPYRTYVGNPARKQEK